MCLCNKRQTDAILFKLLPLSSSPSFTSSSSPTFTSSSSPSFSSSSSSSSFSRGDIAYETNYCVGLRVLEVKGIKENDVKEIGFFDVATACNSSDFHGSWSNYPFFESGTIVNIYDSLVTTVYSSNPWYKKIAKLTTDAKFGELHYSSLVS